MTAIIIMIGRRSSTLDNLRQHAIHKLQYNLGNVSYHSKTPRIHTSRLISSLLTFCKAELQATRAERQNPRDHEGGLSADHGTDQRSM